MVERTAIEMTDLSKRYGAQWVLFHLNGVIRQGESVALFGRNGSGKTTLLKMLATLIPPSAGGIEILGSDAALQKKEIRKGIRFLAHEKQLYGSLSVLENLKLAAGLRGLSRSKGLRQIEGILDCLRMKDFQDRRVSQLSEGMKKRVVLARLLIGDTEPDLIFLDEPYPTLDTEGREILDRLIQEWRKKGKTIVIATHDQRRTLESVDRLLVLENGRIGYDGGPKEIP